MAILWWTALKKSLSCKSQGSCDVIKRGDDSRGGSASPRGIGFKKSPLPRSGCARSISNLRDVLHSARFQAPPGVRGTKCDSPMSVVSGDVHIQGAFGMEDIRRGNIGFNDPVDFTL